MEDIACGKCGMPGFREGTQLPFGWEPYRASDYRGVVWCGGCVDDVLAEVLRRLRTSRDW